MTSEIEAAASKTCLRKKDLSRTRIDWLVGGRKTFGTSAELRFIFLFAIPGIAASSVE